jgi:hypothetical protein
MNGHDGFLYLDGVKQKRLSIILSLLLIFYCQRYQDNHNQAYRGCHPIDPPKRQLNQNRKDSTAPNGNGPHSYKYFLRMGGLFVVPFSELIEPLINVLFLAHASKLTEFLM